MVSYNCPLDIGAAFLAGHPSARTELGAVKDDCVGRLVRSASASAAALPDHSAPLTGPQVGDAFQDDAPRLLNVVALVQLDRPSEHESAVIVTNVPVQAAQDHAEIGEVISSGPQLIDWPTHLANINQDRRVL